MKPVIKEGVALISPQGFLDGNSAPAVFGLAETSYLEIAKVRGLFISLKSVLFFNSNAISYLTNVLEMVASKQKIMVGLCDYNPQQYDLLTKYLGDEAMLTLFESFELAQIYLNPPNHKPQIFIWSDDVSQRGLLFASFYERGCDVLLAKSAKDYADNFSKYLLATQFSRIGGSGRKIASYITGNAIVYTLGGYIDGSVAEGFDKLYHDNLLAVGFRLFIFEVSNVVGFNIHAVRFLARLVVAAAEYGALFVMAGLGDGVVQAGMRRDLEDAGILFYPSLTDALKDPEVAAAQKASGMTMKKRGKGLSKDTLQQLPIFVNAAIQTLEMVTGIHAKKQSIQLDEISLSRFSGEYVAASVGFYGQLEGMITMILPLELAKKASQLFAQEELSHIDDVADALGEMINIIIGKSKVTLALHKISISITIPRTFTKLSELEAVIGSKKGAKIDFLFEQQPFYFFLCR